MEAPPTPADARAFLDSAERQLLELSVESQQADWVRSTYITSDTNALASRASARLLDATLEIVKASRRFADVPLRPDEGRKRERLRSRLSLIPPSEPGASAELSRLLTEMEGAYAQGRYVPRGESTPLDLEALSLRLATERDPTRLAELWEGWHRVGRSIRPGYARFVELSNRGAREIGFADTGEMWRSRYDLPPATFEAEVERLWDQVEPLYRSLHAFVRSRLVATYGPEVVPPRGPIPAHLLGNMWAQSWEHVLPLLRSPDTGSPAGLTDALRARATSATDMVRTAEAFFRSLGLDPLPATFWERSMLVRPRDREVVCHASAWNIDYVDDLRIKMCTEITAEDFLVVHHELGHNYYDRAYSTLPFLFRDSAHDGFHEALGDTIALSVTPEYLGRIGLQDAAATPPDDIAVLLDRALAKVAFLPFGLEIDRWRWKVFSGEIAPDEYTTAWWDLRTRTQGIAPPAPRGSEEFDPGAKYHVPANVPYVRYFLAHILQFQFHRALVREAGRSGPLHRASIYGSEAAGRRLREMMAMGASREWPDALEALTGERRMDGAGLLEYFAPLQRWLDEQNRGQPVGW